MLKLSNVSLLLPEWVHCRNAVLSAQWFPSISRPSQSTWFASQFALNYIPCKSTWVYSGRCGCRWSCWRRSGVRNRAASSPSEPEKNHQREFRCSDNLSLRKLKIIWVLEENKCKRVQFLVPPTCSMKEWNLVLKLGWWHPWVIVYWVWNSITETTRILVVAVVSTRPRQTKVRNKTQAAGQMKSVLFLWSTSAFGLSPVRWEDITNLWDGEYSSGENKAVHTEAEVVRHVPGDQLHDEELRCKIKTHQDNASRRRIILLQLVQRAISVLICLRLCLKHVSDITTHGT